MSLDHDASSRCEVDPVQDIVTAGLASWLQSIGSLAWVRGRQRLL